MSSSLANDRQTDQQRTYQEKLTALILRAEIAAQLLEDIGAGGYPQMRPWMRRSLEREVAAVAADLREAVEEALTRPRRSVAFEGEVIGG